MRNYEPKTRVPKNSGAVIGFSLVGLLLLVLGGGMMLGAETVIHEAAAGTVFISAWLLIAGAGIIHAVNRAGRANQEVQLELMIRLKGLQPRAPARGQDIPEFTAQTPIE